MRIGCSTSFMKDDFETAARKIAGMGFSYIDLIAIKPWNLILPERLVEDFEGQATWIESVLRSNELVPISMNVAVANPADRRDPEMNAQRLKETEAICKLMQRLDIPRAGFFPGIKQQRDPEELYAHSVENFREMLEISQSYGVALGPEFHKNTPFETIEPCAQLLADIPELTIVYDPSHFVMQGIPVAETLPFLKRAHHVHARGSADEKMQCDVADSELSPAGFIQTLQASGYDQDVSIEYLPDMNDVDPEREIVAMYEGLQAALLINGADPSQ